MLFGRINYLKRFLNFTAEAQRAQRDAIFLFAVERTANKKKK
jgi:hypothetical protein